LRQTFFWSHGRVSNASACLTARQRQANDSRQSQKRKQYSHKVSICSSRQLPKSLDRQPPRTTMRLTQKQPMDLTSIRRWYCSRAVRLPQMAMSLSQVAECPKEHQQKLEPTSKQHAKQEPAGAASEQTARGKGMQDAKPILVQIPPHLTDARPHRGNLSAPP